MSKVRAATERMPGEDRPALRIPADETAEALPVGSAGTGPERIDKVKPKRLTNIDGLRGLAITLVLFAHCLPGNFLVNSFHSMPTRFLERFYGSGVELFCLISGMVSLRPFLLRLKRLSLKSYVRRRVERLWPPYFVALSMAGLMVFLFTIHPTYITARLPYPGFNWSDWLSQIFILNLGNPLYCPAWWFLSIEMVFYALVPLLAILVWRFEVTRKRAWVALAISLVIAELAYRGLQADLQAYPGLRLIVLFCSYLPCHVAGMMVARFNFNRTAGIILAAAGVMVIFVWSLYPVFNSHIGNALFFMGLAVLSFESGALVQRWMQKYLLVWVGERSYSIFLFHQTAFHFAAYLVSLLFLEGSLGYYFGSRFIGLPLALLTSMLLFSLLEVRFARGLSTSNDFLPKSLRFGFNLTKVKLSIRIGS